ncbi:uclacyanin 1 [Cajanus cajan]|uniref:Blue copper protein n=1 Tax=Cajanus cajan TaxID=3821 RepID=A0A151QU90_CAJCA|nr:uclacyanin 1 [Cajanus cajan]KYP33853.1 Blue copper protein [Cajanus cajan]
MGVPEIMFRVSYMAILIKLAMATNYIVGGPNGGWDTNSNLQSWASSQVFSVGDSLVFQYPPNHNVVEVTKADYDSCQPTNPIQSYNDGATTIPLTSPGKRYFICGAIGHCSQGMKVEIDTLASATTSAIPAASPEDSTTSPAESPEDSTISPAESPEDSTISPAESPEDSPTAPSPFFQTHLESPIFPPVIPSTEFPASASPLAQHSSDLSASPTRKGNLQASVAVVLCFLMMFMAF